METPVRVTAAVIVRADDRSPTTVLVCQRAADEVRHPLKWEFPGGKVESGETLAEGLRRELEEELGIVAEIGPLLAATRHHYAGRDTVEISFFAVRGYEGSLTNRVFADIRWAMVTELSGLDFLEGDREFVSQLARGDIALD
jgi:8-oxo-dGTP diphosphatase